MTWSLEDCAATVSRWKKPIARAQTNASAKEAVIQRTLWSRCTRILLYGRTAFAKGRETIPYGPPPRNCCGGTYDCQRVSKLEWSLSTVTCNRAKNFYWRLWAYWRGAALLVQPSA